MAGCEPIDVAIGQGQHGRTHPDTTEGMLEELGRDEDRTGKPRVSGFVPVDLYCALY